MLLWDLEAPDGGWLTEMRVADEMLEKPSSVYTVVRPAHPRFPWSALSGKLAGARGTTFSGAWPQRVWWQRDRGGARVVLYEFRQLVP